MPGGSSVTRVRLRIYLGEEEHKLGPGKIQLLEAIREHGSISAAARSMGMAYRHAWELVDDLNRCFRSPVVSASTGGRAGGGAEITELGEELIRRWGVPEPVPELVGRIWEPALKKLPPDPLDPYPKLLTISAASLHIVSQYLACEELDLDEALEDEYSRQLNENIEAHQLANQLKGIWHNARVQRELGSAVE